MKSVKNNNNFLAYLMVLAAFFVLLFFTKNIYGNLQNTLDEKENIATGLSEKKKELNELNALKSELEIEDGEITRQIAPYSQSYTEQSLLQYFYDYAASENEDKDVIIYRSISIGEPEKSDLGFKKVSVNISWIVAGENTLKKFLSYLSADTSEYKFFIESFSYPMNESTGNIQLNIPLTLYVK